MKINSRQKGATGEREFAKYVTSRGYPAHRGRQFSGSADSPDIKLTTVEGVHIEVKRVQQLNIEDAIQQSTKDSGENIPLVAHRRNGEEWKITLWADDFLDFFLSGFIYKGYEVHFQRVKKRETITSILQEKKDG